MIDNTLVRQNTIFGDGVVTGDLAINGGDLTSTATTFNLLNATVTTLNIGGAATVVTIGAATVALGIGGNDVLLSRDAANTLALRNGANAQTFNIYNTYTDASNYERMSLYWSSSEMFLETSGLGTGTPHNLVISAAVIDLVTAGTRAWRVNASGHFTGFTDNTFDIGAVGATRPRTVYLGTSLISPTIYGDTAANGDISIVGTLHATKTTSNVNIQASGGTISFFGGTPTAQGASVADATDAATAITQLNALISRIEATGLIATV